MKKIKLGEILKIEQGYAFKSENYIKKSNVVLVTLGNFTSSNDFQFIKNKATYYGSNYPKEFNLNSGDLIIPMTEQVVGLFGNTAFVPRKIDNIQFVLNQRVGRIVIDSNVTNKKYIHYLLSTELVRQQLEYRASGTKQRNISPSNIYDVTVWIPKLDIQKKIGEILYNLELKIQNNNQINNNLEELMQTLYQRWFIEFNFPNEDGNPYKSSGGKMIWNEELKHEIPEGWNVENLIDNINWIGGSQPPKSTFIYEKKDGYIRFIQNRDYDKEDHITYIKESKSNQLCTRTDIMMDKYGDAGKTRFGLEGAYNVALSKIDVKNKNLKEYIRYFLSSNSIYTYLHNSCIASTRASLNESNLSFLKIVIPNEKILLEFNNIAIKNMDMLLKNKDESKKLTELRDFLLPMLMNGQINVDDVEI